MKSSIDNLWLRFYTDGVSNPMKAIKQINYLLFIKRLDDLEKAKEAKANITGKQIEHTIFSEDEQELRWSNFKNMEASGMYDLVRTKVFDFIKTLGDKDSTFAEYVKNAYLAIPNLVILEQVISMISAISMDDLDTK